ncbi:endonuclease G, mitochondrial isoform X2 [Scaptodrosophila lebanonensis]|uniref:Endonuclease n=1 Tax=Drosophila lebanonensis TaxID=7225 RepID=A0A6J2UBI1_DROLE|nr:endonuclease G, mitochondrial isoform X2 [Scaptodrosophila lebanonensis]
MNSRWQALIVVLGTAVTCFLAGAYFQHDHATRQLQKLVQHDPYAYYVSSKIFKFQFFKIPQDKALSAQRVRLEDIMKYGYPGLDDIHLYSDFVLSYDRRNRVAHWVCEHLRADALGSAAITDRGRGRVRSRSRISYRPDLSVPSNFRAALADYRNSGFDRGHLAAAGNHRTHCDETFYLTNIAPQIGRGFNRAAWNKLEIYVRNLTLRYGSVYVFTGPIYKPKARSNGNWSIEYEMIGSNMVAVPTHFFKVLIVESKLPQGKPYMEAYVLPNARIPDNINLRDYLCDIREIEHYAGLQFFNGLRRSRIFGSNFPRSSQVFQNFG